MTISNRRKLIFPIICILICVSFINAQSRRSAKSSDGEGSILSVVAARTDDKTEPIKIENLYLYENAVEQKIKNFTFDPSPARIVILVDNSLTLQTSVEVMKKAAMEFAYEMYEGDQLFTVAYDEKPETIQEWTDDAKKMEASFANFRKKGNPHLFDALNVSVREVLVPLMPGTRKTVIVVISDGLDRGSRISFDKVLNQLQDRNVTVYGLQLPDRTGGAYRRNQPKAKEVMVELAEGTGGKVFPFDEASAAAKAICDELKKNRYILAYSPTNTSSFDARKLFLDADDGISVRLKAMHPPNVK